MKILTAKPVPINFDSIRKVQPKLSERGKIIDEETIIYVGGKPALAYTFIPADLLDGLRAAVKTTNYAVTHRSNGLPTKSSVFGTLPRVTMRCDYCRVTRPTVNEPENLERIIAFRKHVDDVYQRYFPANYESALAEVKNTIHDDWRFGDTPFLTCNINVNFAIPYHKDAGNMPSALSNVTIVRDGVEGGELVLPEFGVSLSQRDGALVFFDGYKIAHGVLPFRKTREDGYRASIVYYTMRDMRNCFSKQGELERAQSNRMQKELVSSEERRAKLIKVSGSRLKKPQIVG
jgi:hypothetical protein